MKKHIAEDLPARKFPQANSRPSGNDRRPDDRRPGGSGEKSMEERISQAVSDIRNRIKRYKISPREAVEKYLQNSQLPEQAKAEIRKKVYGQGGNVTPASSASRPTGMSVSESILKNIDVAEFAASNLANAMYEVFVEKTDNTEYIDNEYIEELSDKVNSGGDRKYKVRVTDKNGTSYVRYANREKINSLRANPNIESVEMTEYGEPYEGERKGGEQTASSLGGGKAKKDYDGDGKKESPAKEYRGAVHNAIQRKTGGVPDGKDTSSVKEEYFVEGKKKPSRRKKNDGQPLDVMRGSNTVHVNPPESKDKLYAHYEIEIGGGFLIEKSKSKAQRNFMGMVYAAKKGEEPASPEVAAAAASMSKGEAKKFAKTKHKGLPARKSKKNVKEESECGTSTSSKNEVDPRQKATKKSLIASKFQSMGVKNPIVVMGEEGVEPGLNPAHHPNKSKRDKYETQTRRASAPKGVGVPDKSVGYGGIKDSFEPSQKQVDEGVGALAKLAGAAAATWLAGKGMEAAKRSVDSKIDNARKTSPIGGQRYDTRLKKLGMDK
jgi:hypothetical protein